MLLANYIIKTLGTPFPIKRLIQSGTPPYLNCPSQAQPAVPKHFHKMCIRDSVYSEIPLRMRGIFNFIYGR